MNVPTPEYIKDLRQDIGHKELLLPAVTAVVLRRDDDAGIPLPVPQVLLVKRSDDGRWGATAGILEPGEEPGAAAVREVAEETRVQARPVRVTGVSDHGQVVYPNGDICRFLDIAFELEYVSGQPQPGDDEATAAGWFPVDDLPEPFVKQHRERIRWALETGAPARFRQ
ncbi:NUDIX domain-containing protein [Nesterenkonia alkaliphila]|uniref:NUDIX domain-containing protein n=1 Tax=Nesterenkonia alkaliphila TaxID=1463631 RepID=A0A7K1UEB1_9MICC|nr:NUDIX domain-containing protein [Nesterenkonia alkaliphila]GFZ93615.1 putative MutT/NUDIX-family protein [Nesterenkonia alkaliphila]